MARDTLDEERAATPHGHSRWRAAIDKPPREGRGRGRTAGLLALLLLAALAWALIATFDDEEPRGPAAGIALSEVAADAEALAGSTVVVSGEISEVVGAGDAITPATSAATGFIMGEGDEEVLVLGSRIPRLAALRGDDQLATGDVVQVTGTVHGFDVAALEADLDADLADADFAPFDARPVLMATAVNLVPTTAREQLRRGD